MTLDIARASKELYFAYMLNLKSQSKSYIFYIDVQWSCQLEQRNKERDFFFFCFVSPFFFVYHPSSLLFTSLEYSNYGHQITDNKIYLAWQFVVHLQRHSLIGGSIQILHCCSISSSYWLRSRSVDRFLSLWCLSVFYSIHIHKFIYIVFKA